MRKEMSAERRLHKRREQKQTATRISMITEAGVIMQ